MNVGAKLRKFPLVGDILVVLLLFFLAQVAVMTVLPFFGVVVPTVSVIDTVPIDAYMAGQESLAKYCLILYTATMLVPLLLMWIYLRLRGGKGSIRIRCSIAGFNPSVILIGVLWLLSSQVVLEPLVLMLPARQTPGLGLGVWAYITTIGIAPLLEEILCRGVLYESFRNRWGIKVSILLSALFFGLIHFDLATAVVATMAGLIFGVLYVRTSSIFASIIVHAINNALAFALVVVGKDNTPLREMIGDDKIYYIVYGVAAFIFVVAWVEALFKLRAKRLELKAEKEAAAAAEAELETTEEAEESIELAGDEFVNEEFDEESND